MTFIRREVARQRKDGREPTRVVLGLRARIDFFQEVDFHELSDAEAPNAIARWEWLHVFEDLAKPEGYVEIT